MTTTAAEDFYEQITGRLHRRIGRELRLAHRVLDLGCGSCDLVRYLADTYAQKVAGVDISNGTFPPERHTSNGNRYDCLKHDAAALTFAQDGSADAVVSLFALHEMAGAEVILQEARRVLRPGGEILVVDFPRDSLAQQLWNEDYFRPDQIKRLLQEARFEQVHVLSLIHI